VERASLNRGPATERYFGAAVLKLLPSASSNVLSAQNEQPAVLRSRGLFLFLLGLLAILAGVLGHFRLRLACALGRQFGAAHLAHMGAQDGLLRFGAFGGLGHLHHVVILAMRTGHQPGLARDDGRSLALAHLVISRARGADEDHRDRDCHQDTNHVFHNAVSISDAAATDHTSAFSVMDGGGVTMGCNPALR
jgi:hypothetical protein